MKKNSLKILTLASLSALLLAGCNTPTSTSSNEGSSTTSQVDKEPSSSSSEQQAKKWSSAIEAAMFDVIGETLPYIQLDEETLMYSIEEDAYGYFFYLHDTSSKNLVSNYGKALTSAGYKYYGTDTSYGYDSIMYTKGDIVVQFDYCIADGYYGNEIFAWIETEDNGGGSSEVEYLTAWPAEFKEILIDVVGELIPVAPLEIATLDYEAGEDEYGPYAYICDYATKNLLANYGDILENAGYTYYGYDDSYADYGYIAYLYTKGDINIQYGFMDYDGYTSNSIYAWIESEDDNGGNTGGSTTPSTGWPSDIEAEIVSFLGTTIPYIQLDESTLDIWVDDEEGYICIYDWSTVDLISGYGDILEDNGYEYLGYDDSEGYIAYFYQKGNIVIQYDFYNELGYEGNEIYAWLDDSTGGSTGGTTTPSTGSWPTEIENALISFLGTTIPFIQLEEETLDCWIDDEEGYIGVYDWSYTNLISGYGNILKENGYTYYDSDDSLGYTVYFYTKGDLVIQYGYCDISGYEGNEIYAWFEGGSGTGGSTGTSGEALTSWPTSVTNELSSTFGTTLPVAPLDSGSFDYEVYDGIYGQVIVLFDESATYTLDEYGAALEAAGWTHEGNDYLGYFIYTKGNLRIEYGYYADDTGEYPSGNEIYLYGWSGDETLTKEEAYAYFNEYHETSIIDLPDINGSTDYHVSSIFLEGMDYIIVYTMASEQSYVDFLNAIANDSNFTLTEDEEYFGGYYVQASNGYYYVYYYGGAICIEFGLGTPSI